MGALGKGKLDARTRNRIALAVADVNRCIYCLSAHTTLGRDLAKLDDAEMRQNQRGASSDPKANIAVAFAAKLVRERGHVAATDIAALEGAGYDPAQIVEIIAHVALNTLTNYINSALGTEVDFPSVAPVSEPTPRRATDEPATAYDN